WRAGLDAPMAERFCESVLEIHMPLRCTIQLRQIHKVCRQLLLCCRVLAGRSVRNAEPGGGNVGLERVHAMDSIKLALGSGLELQRAPHYVLDMRVDAASGVPSAGFELVLGPPPNLNCARDDGIFARVFLKTLHRLDDIWEYIPPFEF